MHKLLLSLAMASIALTSCAQDSHLDKFYRNYRNLRLIILDGEKNPSSRQEWTDLEQSLRQDRFDELLTIRKGNDRVRLLSKEGTEGIKQVAFLVAAKDGSGLFFHFRGHFTASDMVAIQTFLQHHDSQ